MEIHTAHAEPIGEFIHDGHHKPFRALACPIDPSCRMSFSKQQTKDHWFVAEHMLNIQASWMHYWIIWKPIQWWLTKEWLMQIKYLRKPGNKFQDKSQMRKESPFWAFFWYAWLHSFLFAKRKYYQDKKVELEMMSQAIPRSLNFGKSNCCLSPERSVLRPSRSGQLALAGWDKERTSPGDSRINAKASEAFLSCPLLPEKEVAPIQSKAFRAKVAENHREETTERARIFAGTDTIRNVETDLDAPWNQRDIHNSQPQKKASWFKYF